MEEKEIKQQFALVIAENIKMKAELLVLKETLHELISPEKLEAIKEKELKSKIKIQNSIKNNYQINDPELKILFLREFHPYKTDE